jgi:hypothetical protein
MQCIEHDRSVRCTNPTKDGDSLCPLHRSHVNEATAQASEARWKATAEATKKNTEAMPGATDPWLGAMKTENSGEDRPQLTPNWRCVDPDCYRCKSKQPGCHAVLERTGLPCGFPARKNRPFCINHDPLARDQHRAQSVRGGSARRRPAVTVEPSDILVSLHSRAGIQAVLHAVVTAELLGQISPTRSRNVIRALEVASRNFDTDPENLVEQAQLYHDYAEILTASLNNILEESAISDTPPEPPAPPPPSSRTRSIEEVNVMKLLTQLTGRR